MYIKTEESPQRVDEISWFKVYRPSDIRDAGPCGKGQTGDARAHRKKRKVLLSAAITLQLELVVCSIKVGLVWAFE